ncbi:hypothetical protein KMZ29_21820 [Bradyrhizobium sediminis]|uniref:Uncharacterized protein n=1 Tax=Bradyrhizobium sediminis TaxID=2840469 RepID=A0A975NCK1_9BRAD|nr:hypothetical protein [Bradyrhizobium sediminis]QWG12320.1 hypothetical protein KMZ29_21820 [Bradyrhizobium sediminis]
MPRLLVLTAIALVLVMLPGATLWRRLGYVPAEADKIRAGVTTRPKLCYLNFQDI